MNNCALVLGTFDGLHIGHMAVLNAALNFKNCTPVAVTFPEPPKRKTSGAFVPMLLSFEQKSKMLKEIGFKEVFVLKYDEVHEMSPTDFLDMLFKRYSVKAVVCGFNYRFGAKGAGDVALISEYCRSHAAEAVIVPATSVSGQVVSSTLIRELISDGNISFANKLLGYPYFIEGQIIQGDQRGRTMGFPTVNQPLDAELAEPKFGVYATAVTVNGNRYPAVTNIGIRPTFLLKKPLAETNIIGFEGDLYGKSLKVELLEYLRAEVRFSSIDELKAAIEKDKEKAQKAFDTINKLKEGTVK